MAEKRGRSPGTEDSRAPAEEEWVDEQEQEEEWVDDTAASGGKGTAEWEEEEARPTEQDRSKRAQVYYSWIAGLVGLIIGLLSFRACR